MSTLSVTGGGPRRDSIIKPILLNKDEVSHVLTKVDVDVLNNFEQIHPKDDCELRKDKEHHLQQQQQHHGGGNYTSSSSAPDSASMNGVASNNNYSSSANTPPPPSPRQSNNNKSGSSGSNTPIDESVATTDSPQPGAATHKNNNSRGNSNAKRSNYNNRSNNKSQSSDSSDDPGMTATKVERIIDRMPLSSSEIQNLIDILLNKQHAGDSEWINKTKTDNSVAGLKKQLEVRDKMLQEEQAAVATLQAKLKELRNEFTNEKNKFAGMKRHLDAEVQGKGIEVNNLQVSFIFFIYIFWSVILNFFLSFFAFCYYF